MGANFAGKKVGALVKTWVASSLVLLGQWNG